MADVEARVVTDEHYELAEGPVWDEATGRVLWVDIPAGAVFEGLLPASPGKGNIEVVARTQLPGTVGAVVPTRDGGRLAAGQRGPTWITPGGVQHHGEDLIDASVPSRLNDGACDPAGRFLVGSLPFDDRRGDERLYRIDADGSAQVIDEGFTMSNGIGFRPDGAVLYHVDSVPGIITQRSYTPQTGAFGPRQEIFRPEGGTPDGLTVDVDGNLWVAMWGPGEVRRYAPDGTLLGVVEVPAPHTTCVAFVGPAYDRLLITTAREDMSAEQLARYPLSGRLFLADVGFAGLPTPVWAGTSERSA